MCAHWCKQEYYRIAENFRENNEYKDFTDSYYRPDMGCAHMRRVQIHEIRESFLPRKFPVIQYIKERVSYLQCTALKLGMQSHMTTHT